MPDEVTRQTAMLSGFLSAFARAIIRRRDEELSVDGCRNFGNTRVSTEGLAGRPCDTLDEAARRCSIQGADLSPPIDPRALIRGTRTLQMRYARICGSGQNLGRDQLLFATTTKATRLWTYSVTKTNSNALSPHFLLSTTTLMASRPSQRHPPSR